MSNCQTVRDINGLSETMLQLQYAIKSVSENWNDSVSAAIQTNHINAIISLCNSINSQLNALGVSIEANYNQLEELVYESSRSPSNY